MKNSHTTNTFTGRAIGATFFAAFGALWLFLSLYARQELNPATIAGIFFGLALLLLAIFQLVRESSRFPRVPSDPAQGRAFTWINAIQWLAVCIVAFGCAKLHLETYVISAITFIVGVHMFPLARLFRYPLHNVTGAALVIWAAATVALVPAEQLQGITSMGTGVILWLSAAATLGIALRATRQSEQQTAC